RDPRARERFLREGRAAAALDHPNIVRLHDVSQGGGVHFLVMEYVEGRDLQSALDESRPVPYARAVHYAAQAAAGLRHAHDKGFVHRAVRPANLLLAKGGLVKLLGTGLARTFGDESDGLTQKLTNAAAAAEYAPPEQALNEPVDERSDVYSLGVTLFALISGRPPATDPPRLPERLAPPELAGVAGAAALVAVLVAVFGFGGREHAAPAEPAVPQAPAPKPKVPVDPAAAERFLPLALTRVANVSTVHHLFGNPDAKARLVFDDW